MSIVTCWILAVADKAYVFEKVKEVDSQHCQRGLVKTEASMCFFA